MTKHFEARLVGDEMRIRVYGPIGSWNINSQEFAYALAETKRQGKTKICVCINSPGGDAFEGMAIRSQLVSWAGETRCEIEGLAASAASIVAMGCKSIGMHIGAAMMIHEASLISGQPMTADDLEKAQRAIETLNDGLASVYAKRTGKTKKECMKLMSEETWLTADQAVTEKFADEVLDADDAVDAGVAAQAFAAELKRYGYHNVPEKFRAAAGDDDETEQSQGDEPSDDEDDEDETEVPPVVIPPNPLPPKEIPPPSAAQTAEASASRKRLETMTIKLIATAAGLAADAEESAVVAAVSQLNGFVAELKTLTKTPSLEAALGYVRGLQAAADQVPVLTAKIDAQAQQLEAQERAQLIAADKADPKGRKLTPALEAWIATLPLEAAKAYLAAAPHLVQMSGSENKGQQQPAPAAGTATGTMPLAHNGKTWEQMSGAEKHDLFVSDKSTYDALKANHVERGRPAAQSQQQRASA